MDAGPAGLSPNEAPVRLVCLALVLALLALLLRIVTVELAFASGLPPVVLADGVSGQLACAEAPAAFSGCSPIAASIGRTDRRPARQGWSAT
jgi:hypothetical protein